MASVTKGEAVSILPDDVYEDCAFHPVLPFQRRR
jgi:hypothetical protein